ncbi:MAG: cytochrome-c peroxidase [Halieaceae bacterium]|jgi:cytochrome c peroxidase|nr:cytochrome-c peroxidase [Halieaceae bacterium]
MTLAFTLSDRCPPSFMIDENGKCQLVSLYQRYSAPEGFGGLRKPLPEARDGFSPQEIDLGRYLFFDPLLGGDKKTSCAHCHHPDYGYADGRGTAMGFGGSGVGAKRRDGAELERGAPTLWNVAFLRRLFWDWRATSLEEQAQGPLFAAAEMGNTPAQLEADINANGTYRRLFTQAYGLAHDEKIGTALIIQALVAFEASLVSLNSRYDHYAHGDHNALSEQEQIGHNIFRSFVTRCSQCHTPPLFTNVELAVIGAPEPPGKNFDLGADPIFPDMKLRGAFKVPTLRNISRTAPYMHSGSLERLQDVVEFYNDKRGHAAPEEQNLIIHWHITNPNLRKEEETALIAFLNSLEDETAAPVVPNAVPSGLGVVSVEADAGLKN